MVGLYTGSMVGDFRETGSMVGKQGVWRRNWEYGRETGSMVGKYQVWWGWETGSIPSRKFSAFPGSDSAAAELTLIIFSSAISSYFISLLIHILRNLPFTNTDVTRNFYTIDNNIFINNFLSQCSFNRDDNHDKKDDQNDDSDDKVDSL